MWHFENCDNFLLPVIAIKATKETKILNFQQLISN